MFMYCDDLIFTHLIYFCNSIHDILALRCVCKVLHHRINKSSLKLGLVNYNVIIDLRRLYSGKNILNESKLISLLSHVPFPSLWFKYDRHVSSSLRALLTQIFNLEHIENVSVYYYFIHDIINNSSDCQQLSQPLIRLPTNVDPSVTLPWHHLHSIKLCIANSYNMKSYIFSNARKCLIDDCQFNLSDDSNIVHLDSPYFSNIRLNAFPNIKTLRLSGELNCTKELFKSPLPSTLTHLSLYRFDDYDNDNSITIQSTNNNNPFQYTKLEYFELQFMNTTPHVPNMYNTTLDLILSSKILKCLFSSPHFDKLTHLSLLDIAEYSVIPLSQVFAMNDSPTKYNNITHMHIGFDHYDEFTYQIPHNIFNLFNYDIFGKSYQFSNVMELTLLYCEISHMLLLHIQHLQTLRITYYKSNLIEIQYYMYMSLDMNDSYNNNSRPNDVIQTVIIEDCENCVNNNKKDLIVMMQTFPEVNIICLFCNSVESEDSMTRILSRQSCYSCCKTRPLNESLNMNEMLTCIREERQCCVLVDKISTNRMFDGLPDLTRGSTIVNEESNFSHCIHCYQDVYCTICYSFQCFACTNADNKQNIENDFVYILKKCYSCNNTVCNLTSNDMNSCFEHCWNCSKIYCRNCVKNHENMFIKCMDCNRYRCAPLSEECPSSKRARSSEYCSGSDGDESDCMAYLDPYWSKGEDEAFNSESYYDRPNCETCQSLSRCCRGKDLPNIFVY